MNANDYLIDQTGVDWQPILAGWAEILPTTLTIWLVNRFGDVVAVVDDGSVHLLDLAAGTFYRVAENRQEFVDLIDKPQNANNWLIIPLVDQLVALGMVLQPGQCYAFKVPPFLGGAYTPDNVAPVDLPQNYAFLADLWSQTKDVPDGAPVRLVIRPDDSQRQ